MYIKEKKEKLQAGIYLRKTSRQLDFKSLCREDKIYRTNNIFLLTLLFVFTITI